MLKNTNKGLATRTIIALVIGIIVLAIGLYMVYIQVTNGNASLDCSRCMSYLKGRCSYCCGIGISQETMCAADATNVTFCGSCSTVNFQSYIPCASLGVDLSTCGTIIGNQAGG